jgi:hypothetical protein
VRSSARVPVLSTELATTTTTASTAFGNHDACARIVAHLTVVYA